MSRLPQISGKQVQAAFARIGYSQVSQKGSHVKIRRDDPRRTLIIPNHKTLKRGTLRGIIADAGLTVEEFLKLL